jgi:hypothetical protein
MFLKGGAGGGRGGGAGGMPGGFACHFGGMDGGSMPGGGGGGMGGGGIGPGGVRMMFSQMGGMPGGGGGGGMGGMFPGMDFGGPGMMFGGMPGMAGMGSGRGGGGRGGAGRSVRPKQQPAKFNVHPPRTAVCIQGLRSAAHQNGKRGTVLAYDPARERYTAQLDECGDENGGAEQLSVKAENLHAIVDAELVELESTPELNGTKGTLLSHDAEQDRYHVRLHDGRVAALAPHNVILPAETRCVVTGLAAASAQQYNGRRAKVVSYDHGAGRYEVMVSEGNHLRLKRENVRC